MAAKNQRKCVINCEHGNFGEMPRTVDETLELNGVVVTTRQLLKGSGS
jgi:hypothetical protein